MAFALCFFCATHPAHASADRFAIKDPAAPESQFKVVLESSKVAAVEISIDEVTTAETLALSMTSYAAGDPKRNATQVGFAIDDRTTGDVVTSRSIVVHPADTGFRVNLDASRIRVGEDQIVSLNIAPDEGESQQLELLLTWSKPGLFPLSGEAERKRDLVVSDTGRGLAFLHLGSLRLVDGVLRISPAALIGSSSGEEAAIQIELVNDLCDAGTSDSVTGGVAIAVNAAAECDRVPIRLIGAALRPGEPYYGVLDVRGEPDIIERIRFSVKRTQTERAAVPVLRGSATVESTLSLRCIWSRAKARLHPLLSRLPIGERAHQATGAEPPPGVVESDSEPTPGSCTPQVTLGLWEKSGTNALNALALGFVDTEPGTLASSDALKAELFRDRPAADGSNAVATDLWNLDRTDIADIAARSLLAGDRATLRLTPAKSLPAGEHKVSVRLYVDNADAANLPTVQLVFRVRWTKWVPFLVLVLSVLISYGVSRGISLNRRHRKLRQKCGALIERGSRKAFTLNNAPVVYVRAELARIEKALEKSRKLISWISVPGDLEERLAIAERRLPVLEELCDRVKYWDRRDKSDWLTRRAHKHIREIIKVLAETDSSEDFSSEALKALADVQLWEQPAQASERYWLHLKQDIEILRAGINLRSFAGPDVNAIEDPLTRLLSDYQRLSVAFKAVNRLRGEVETVAQSAGDQEPFIPLWRIMAVDPDDVSAVNVALQSATAALDQVETSGLKVLKTNLAQAREIVGRVPIGELWLLLGRAKGGLEQVDAKYPGKATVALRNIEKLTDKTSSDWLARSIGEIDQAIATGESTEREKIRAIICGLETDESPANIVEAIRREQDYAALKLIWECRRISDLDNERAELVNHPQGVEQFFRKADGLAWKNLVDHGLKISEPRAFSSQQELRLIQFRIEPIEAEDGRNYLFKHGIDYTWTIKCGNRSLFEGLRLSWARFKARLDNSEVDEWSNVKLSTLRSPTCQEPSIKQFIPAKYDVVEVSAKAVKRPTTADEPAGAANIGDASDQSETSPDIQPVKFRTRMSDELRWRKSFQRGELIALAVALFVAVITGMQSDPFAATLLGSYDAYLGLVVWGIASERATKLLADIDRYRND